MWPGINVPCGRDLGTVEAPAALSGLASEHARVEPAAEGITDKAVPHAVVHVAGLERRLVQDFEVRRGKERRALRIEELPELPHLPHADVCFALGIGRDGDDA